MKKGWVYFFVFGGALFLTLESVKASEVKATPSNPSNLFKESENLFDHGSIKPLISKTPVKNFPSNSSFSLSITEEKNIESFAEKAKRLFGNPKVIQSHRTRPFIEPPDQELSDEVKQSPLEKVQREKIVQELFIQAGANPSTIELQDIGRGAHNIMVMKTGESDRVIVIGAHHDKVNIGAGTIDNWTGAAMVTNLYQVLKYRPIKHTLIFIAFGREEEGLLGSRYYVNNLSRNQLARIDAMINLDTLGVDGTFSWKNNSDPNLLRIFMETSRKTGLNLIEAFLHGGDSDSSPFRWAGVPAMTLFGASPEIVFDIIHSRNDHFGQFNLSHYKNSFLLTKATLEVLDKNQTKIIMKTLPYPLLQLLQPVPIR